MIQKSTYLILSLISANMASTCLTAQTRISSIITTGVVATLALPAVLASNTTKDISETPSFVPGPYQPGSFAFFKHNQTDHETELTSLSERYRSYGGGYYYGGTYGYGYYYPPKELPDNYRNFAYGGDAMILVLTGDNFNKLKLLYEELILDKFKLRGTSQESDYDFVDKLFLPFNPVKAMNQQGFNSSNSRYQSHVVSASTSQSYAWAENDREKSDRTKNIETNPRWSLLGRIDGKYVEFNKNIAGKNIEERATSLAKFVAEVVDQGVDATSVVLKGGDRGISHSFEDNDCFPIDAATFVQGSGGIKIPFALQDVKIGTVIWDGDDWVKVTSIAHKAQDTVAPFVLFSIETGNQEITHSAVTKGHYMLAKECELDTISGSMQSLFPGDQLYKASRLMAKVNTENGSDYCLIEVDKQTNERILHKIVGAEIHNRPGIISVITSTGNIAISAFNQQGKNTGMVLAHSVQSGLEDLHPQAYAKLLAAREYLPLAAPVTQPNGDVGHPMHEQLGSLINQFCELPKTPCKLAMAVLNSMVPAKNHVEFK